MGLERTPADTDASGGPSLLCEAASTIPALIEVTIEDRPAAAKALVFVEDVLVPWRDIVRSIRLTTFSADWPGRIACVAASPSLVFILSTSQPNCVTSARKYCFFWNASISVRRRVISTSWFAFRVHPSALSRSSHSRRRRRQSSARTSLGSSSAILLGM
ncbi:unnamed protein product [Somion occarium]|uniref:Uncharacterized protein n=1 Tax=Somion occarium TaxID=3059160 RepID=A0ABP1E626_9APHY